MKNGFQHGISSNNSPSLLRVESLGTPSALPGICHSQSQGGQLSLGLEAIPSFHPHSLSDCLSNGANTGWRAAERIHEHQFHRVGSNMYPHERNDTGKCFIVSLFSSYFTLIMFFFPLNNVIVFIFVFTWTNFLSFWCMWELSYSRRSLYVEYLTAPSASSRHDVAKFTEFCQWDPCCSSTPSTYACYSKSSIAYAEHCLTVK